MEFSPIARLVAGALEGDLGAFASLARYPHTAIKSAVPSGTPLVLRREALRKVLQAFQANDSAETSELLHGWAWFVRSGHVPGTTGGPISPLEIDYDPVWEDQIAEIVSRLSELGDSIDGVIDAAELAEMLRTPAE